MPHGSCTQCHRPGRLLPSSSEGAVVDYYRCDACGHVWTRDKANPDAKPRDITITPKKG